MASTIGTNIVQDGDAELKLLETIMQSLEKFYQHEKASKYQEMAKTIGEHISNGGQCSFKLIPQKFTEGIREELDKLKVPFVELPDTNGNIAFVVRDKDSEKFLEAQRNVFRRSTDFFKQVNLKDIALTAQKNKDPLLSLEIKDDGMRFIAEQKLYQAGIVSAKNGEKLYIEQNDYFNKDGDITDFEMMFALDQSLINVPGEKMEAGYPVPEDILAVRKQQAIYDKKQINTFINQAKQGMTVVLGDIYDNSSKYLKAENGKVTLYENTKDGQRLEKPLEIDLKDDNSAYALLSFQTDKIFNMACMDNYTFDEIKSGNKFVISESMKRPVLKGEKSKEIKKISNNDFSVIINKAILVANERIQANSNFNKFSPIENKRLKKDMLLGILKGHELPEIKEFLNNDSINENGKVILTKEEKQKWFNDFVEKFEHVNDKDKDDLLIKEESARNVLHELENTLDLGMDKENEPDRTLD